MALAALAVFALFVSGALMSARKLDYTPMLTMHRVGLAVLVAGCALAFILLEKKL